MKVRLANTDVISTLVEFNFAMALEVEPQPFTKTRRKQSVSLVFENRQYGFCVVVDAVLSVASLMTTVKWSHWRGGCFGEYKASV